MNDFVLALTLLVRDEADVIAANIEHHLNSGVDMVIVTDNGSVDGTTEILHQYARAGVVDLRFEPGHVFAQAEWVTTMARFAFERYGASWVINADADEFWRSKRGRSLREELERVPQYFGMVRAWRVNLVAAAGETGPWCTRLRYRDLCTMSERGTPLGPKVCHRATVDVVIEQGNHQVRSAVLGPVHELEPLEIIHVPLRSFDQYCRRTMNGGTSYERNRNLGLEVGWHTRADYVRLKAGTLVDAYRSRLPSRTELTSMTERYRLDEQFSEYLAGLQDVAVNPDLLRAALAS